ncbi:hypothetical protein [Kitasatospora sp. NPDC097643]|uniref:hypothetical protein n=1 Tax=Kitasatospora sp. NPDC097643 TaxID=3157230 RepID=UPI00332D35BF
MVNTRNHTPHHGTVRDKVRHYKDQQWYFLLRTASGRKLTKRYPAADLRADN